MPPSGAPAIDDLEAWLAASFSREHTGVYDGLKLEPVRRVLAALPSPPPDPVTVAGTKGKGSTIRFLEQLLLAGGRRTLAFTSPHVAHITERWRRDGEAVAERDAIAAARRVADAEGATGETLTYFERCFLIACVLAADDRDAHFLCEVGLGGRLDCANVLDARIAILTHLSHDHCHILGHELTAIAGEKLAVSRPGRPLLIADQSTEARTAIDTRMPIGVTPEWVAPCSNRCQLGLPGEHQRGNAGVALRAAACLGVELAPAARDRALQASRLAARCQLLEQGGRRLLVDGAHNAPSVAATLAVADASLDPDWWLIIGCATDKDLARIVAVSGARPHVLRGGYRGPRACTARDWPKTAQDWPWVVDVAAAIERVPAQADCCILGSFYLAAEALEHLAAASPPG